MADRPRKAKKKRAETTVATPLSVVGYNFSTASAAVSAVEITSSAAAGGGRIMGRSGLWKRMDFLNGVVMGEVDERDGRVVVLRGRYECREEEEEEEEEERKVAVCGEDEIKENAKPVAIAAILTTASAYNHFSLSYVAPLSQYCSNNFSNAILDLLILLSLLSLI